MKPAVRGEQHGVCAEGGDFADEREVRLARTEAGLHLKRHAAELHRRAGDEVHRRPRGTQGFGGGG
jgi:hypothetical protein